MWFDQEIEKILIPVFLENRLLVAGIFWPNKLQNYFFSKIMHSMHVIETEFFALVSIKRTSKKFHQLSSAKHNLREEIRNWFDLSFSISFHRLNFFLAKTFLLSLSLSFGYSFSCCSSLSTRVGVRAPNWECWIRLL